MGGRFIMNSFHTTTLTAAMPLPHNLQLVFMWLLTAILYDAVDHPIFRISENDGFPSDTRQHDRFKHQNVWIRWNENKINKNSDTLLTCWQNTSQTVYRSINITCHRQHLYFFVHAKHQVKPLVYKTQRGSVSRPAHTATFNHKLSSPHECWCSGMSQLINSSLYWIMATTERMATYRNISRWRNQVSCGWGRG